VHWADAIDEFRDRLERQLSPTIRRRLKREFADAFARARRRVQRKMARYGETRAAAALPEDCLYTIDQALGEWLPPDGAPHPD
jgi:Domain of unknown function DUF29